MRITASDKQQYVRVLGNVIRPDGDGVQRRKRGRKYSNLYGRAGINYTKKSGYDSMVRNDVNFVKSIFGNDQI